MAHYALTGATGAFGAVLIPRLLADGHTLRILTRSNNNASIDGIAWVTGNISEKSTFDRLCIDADMVIHMAAMNPLRDNDEDYTQRNAFITSNVLLSYAVAAASKRHGCALMHISTVGVYELFNTPVDHVFNESLYDTALTTPKARAFMQQCHTHRRDCIAINGDITSALAAYLPNSESVYGLTKYAGEPSQANSVIIRFSDIYGPHQRGLLNDVVHTLHDQKTATCSFGKRRYITPIHINDAVHALLTLHPNEALAAKNVFNVTGGHSITAPDLANILHQITNIRISSRATDNAATRYYNTDKAQESGWQATTDLQAGLRNLWQTHAA